MKIALIEMDLKFEDGSYCTKSCDRLLKLCSTEEVKIAFFPEMTLSGFSMNLPVLNKIYLNCQDFFKRLCNSYNLSIGYGYVEVIKQKGSNHYKIQNIEGESITYTKIHPFSYGEEDKFYESGNSLSFINIEDIKICPLICYDLRFPEIFQIASKSCHLITVAANWPMERQDHFVTLLKARAIENQCYIAGINRTASGNGINYIGGSCLFDPYGNLVSPTKIIKDKNDTIFIYNILKDEVLTAQRNFPIKKDRREDIYFKEEGKNI